MVSLNQSRGDGAAIITPPCRSDFPVVPAESSGKTINSQPNSKMKIFILIYLVNSTPIAATVFSSETACDKQAEILNTMAGHNAKAMCLENYQDVQIM